MVPWAETAGSGLRGRPVPRSQPATSAAGAPVRSSVAASQHRLSAPAWCLCVPHLHLRRPHGHYVKEHRSASVLLAGLAAVLDFSGRRRTLMDDRRRRPGTELRRELRLEPKMPAPQWIGKRASSQVRAVAVGFEPTNGLPRYTLSRRAPLAARTRHRERGY